MKIRNVLFGTRRQILWFWQRLVRGWDDREIWSLDMTFGQWIVPRLKLLKRKKHGTPAFCFRESDCSATGQPTKAGWRRARKRWNAVMDEMIEGFALLGTDGCSDDPETQAKIDRAFDLLEQHHGSLWD